MNTRSPSVVLSGDLDISGSAALRLLLDVIDAPGTVDMRSVTYIDARGLSELARVARRVGTGEVTLVVAGRNVRRVLDLVRFDELFHIVDGSRMHDHATAGVQVKA